MRWFLQQKTRPEDLDKALAAFFRDSENPAKCEKLLSVLPVFLKMVKCEQADKETGGYRPEGLSKAVFKALKGRNINSDDLDRVDKLSEGLGTIKAMVNDRIQVQAEDPGRESLTELATISTIIDKLPGAAQELRATLDDLSEMNTYTLSR